MPLKVANVSANSCSKMRVSRDTCQIYTYIIHIHIHIHIFTYTYTPIHIHVHRYTHTTHSYTHTYTYTHTHIHTYTHIIPYTYTIHIHIHPYTYTYTDTNLHTCILHHTQTYCPHGRRKINATLVSAQCPLLHPTPGALRVRWTRRAAIKHGCGNM